MKRLVLSAGMKNLALFTLLCAVSQAQSRDTRLMTPAEYKEVLHEVELGLPKWEAALKRVDPAKTNVSYAFGKRIEGWRGLGLKEVAWVSQSTNKERAKHTVSGELALQDFLRGVYDMMDNVVQTEDEAGIVISDLEKYAPEVSSLAIRIGNDVTARVELLEKATCPSKEAP
jgi:hypothetical protein